MALITLCYGIPGGTSNAVTIVERNLEDTVRRFARILRMYAARRGVSPLALDYHVMRQRSNRLTGLAL